MLESGWHLAVWWVHVHQVVSSKSLSAAGSIHSSWTCTGAFCRSLIKIQILPIRKTLLFSEHLNEGPVKLLKQIQQGHFKCLQDNPEYVVFPLTKRLPMYYHFLSSYHKTISLSLLCIFFRSALRTVWQFLLSFLSSYFIPFEEENKFKVVLFISFKTWR